MKMASTHAISTFSDVYVGLVTGSFQTNLYPGTGMTGNVNLYFPTDTGPTGAYLSSLDGAGRLGWYTQSIINIPPTARNDYYRTRTNELLRINVLTGISANTGGTDIPGTGPTGVAATITNVTIVKNVTRGTLTATGGLGNYTYRSLSRYTGRDYFSYTITNSAGATSRNIGTCTIDVVASGVTLSATSITGPIFAYGLTGITYDRLGVQSRIYIPPFGVNEIATNRDDNLIYFSDTSGTTRIYFYDYVNSITGTVDLSGATAIGSLGVFSFGNCAATYANKVLYAVSNPTLFSFTETYIYRLVMGPYTTNGATGYQKVLSSAGYSFGNYDGGGDLAYDPASNTNAIINANGAAHCIMFCPTSWNIYDDNIIASSSGNNQIAVGYNKEFYLSNTSSVYLFNKYTSQYQVGVTAAALSVLVIDMSEYMNETVT